MLNSYCIRHMKMPPVSCTESQVKIREAIYQEHVRRQRSSANRCAIERLIAETICTRPLFEGS